MTSYMPKLLPPSTFASIRHRKSLPLVVGAPSNVSRAMVFPPDPLSAASPAVGQRPRSWNHEGRSARVHSCTGWQGVLLGLPIPEQMIQFWEYYLFRALARAARSVNKILKNSCTLIGTSSTKRIGPDRLESRSGPIQTGISGRRQGLPSGRHKRWLRTNPRTRHRPGRHRRDHDGASGPG
jgi:hypothetical protein